MTEGKLLEISKYSPHSYRNRLQSHNHLVTRNLFTVAFLVCQFTSKLKFYQNPDMTAYTSYWEMYWSNVKCFNCCIPSIPKGRINPLFLLCNGKYFWLAVECYMLVTQTLACLMSWTTWEMQMIYLRPWRMRAAMWVIHRLDMQMLMVVTKS